MKLYMNYLGFFGFLSLIGIIGIMLPNSSFTLTFLAYIGDFCYFFVKPDELFKKRVYQTAVITLLISFLVQLGFYLAYLITDQVDYFVNGFWISFTVMTVTFPITFFVFEIKDGSV